MLHFAYNLNQLVYDFSIKMAVDFKICFSFSFLKKKTLKKLKRPLSPISKEDVSEQ